MLLAVSLYSNVSAIEPSFWNQPIDLILYDLLVWFGWIPIVIVLLWGCTQIWLTTRQEKWVKSLKYVLMAVDVPAVTEQTPKALENMFASLWGAYSSLTWKEKWIIGKTQPLFTFEIASSEGYVQFYIRTLTRYRDVTEAGIYAAYPEAEITEVEDYTAWAPSHFPHDVWDVWGTELKLKNPEIFPLRTYADFEDKISGELKDPLGGILEQLAKMRPGEHMWIQMIIQPNGNDWKKAGEKFINKTFGVEEKHKPGMIESAIGTAFAVPNALLDEALGISMSGGDSHAQQDDMWKAFKITMAEKEQVEGVLKKIGKVGYKTKMRIVYLGRKGVYDKQARTAFVKGMFNQFAHLNMNALGLHGEATPKDDYFWQAWTYPERQGKLVRAFRGRSWGTGADPWILNVEELATLWHFPSLLVKAPLVKKAEAKRAEPPVGLPIGPDDHDPYAGGPPKPPAPEPAPVGRGTHAPSHGSSHEPESVETHIEPPEIHLPPIVAESVATSDGHPAPMVVSSHVEAELSHVVQVDPKDGDEEEGEAGLDATDMGPPADVELPGPPPGWKEDGEEGGDVPKNLPV